MVFAIECPIQMTLKMAEKAKDPEKIGDVGSHLSSSGHPAKPLFQGGVGWGFALIGALKGPCTILNVSYVAKSTSLSSIKV